MLFKRKIYKQILNWKKESNGTTALLIEGARRVGKSTIVTEFAKNEYQSFILVDFDKEGDDLKEIFSHGFGNLDSFFMSLILISFVNSFSVIKEPVSMKSYLPSCTRYLIPS